MFGALRNLFSPRPVAPAGVPPEVRRQMTAVARMGNLNLLNRQEADFCFMMAVFGLRLGIDFDRDSDAGAKFIIAVKTLQMLQESGVDITDDGILNALRAALRQAGLR